MLRGFFSILAVTIATGAAVSGAFAVEPANPAHQIAQKFAAPTEQPADATAKPGTLVPALAKTAVPKSATPKSAVPKSALPTAATLKPQVANAERPPLDYEMEMLRRARAEQTATANVPASVGTQPATIATSEPDTTKSAPPTVPLVAPVTPPASAPMAVQATPPPQPTPVTLPVPVALPPSTVAPPPATVASPPSTVAQATAPVAKAAEVAPPITAPIAAQPSAPQPIAPQPGATPAAKPELQAKTEPLAVTPAPSPAATGGPVARASLLLALETGGASSNSGASSSFDPILCIADACFVSAGLNADAVRLSKLDALKLKSTTDASPDSCKSKVGCVFRNVSIPAGAQLQVIELGSASHDPSRMSDAPLDPSCKVSDGALNCENPIATSDFRIWVVPEEIARTAGVQAIEDVVADGLPHEDVARATDK
jgi:hypothetical protein